ncbi:hypothetical protein [Robertkochia aurantiaca]|uniref:hypothetical protein n=1 Tax=Robertkochia aurantiaca TaxID=2873700 RepID=UPI001CCB9F3C|nr:hypothetical protein [Robertkochia sp. 3YJGBD-33]
MKKIAFALAGMVSLTAAAQSDASIKNHYESFYQQMKSQGDIRGAIDGLTHLLVLEPTQARKDTLAYYYLNANMHNQAINVLGAEKDTDASDLAVEVKAIALKSLNQPQLAVQQFDILFSRQPDVFKAYELVDLNLQIGKIAEAETYIKYGLENAKDDEMLPFYEAKPPYQVPIKAAFKYQEGLLKYNQDKTNFDQAISLIDEAIVMAPNFALAKRIKELLLKQKEAAQQPATGEDGGK